MAKNGDKPDPGDWAGLIEDDPDFADEFARTFDNPEAKEADEGFDPDSTRIRMMATSTWS